MHDPDGRVAVVDPLSPDLAGTLLRLTDLLEGERGDLALVSIESLARLDVVCQLRRHRFSVRRRR